MVSINGNCFDRRRRQIVTQRAHIILTLQIARTTLAPDCHAQLNVIYAASPSLAQPLSINLQIAGCGVFICGALVRNNIALRTKTLYCLSRLAVYFQRLRSRNTKCHTTRVLAHFGWSIFIKLRCMQPRTKSSGGGYADRHSSYDWFDSTVQRFAYIYT